MSRIKDWLGGFLIRDEARRGGTVYVFLDESGTLGFGKRSSQYFVVACAVTRDVRGLERIPRKVFRGFLKKGKQNRKGMMLHASKETDQTRKKFLQLIAAHSGSDVFALVMEKKKVPEQLRGEKHFLYNQCTEQLLDAVIEKYGRDSGVTLVASRRETNKYLNKVFSERIRRRVYKQHGVSMDVAITPPFHDKSLQVADILAWAVFHKYENEDDRWCAMLGSGSIEEIFYS